MQQQYRLGGGGFEFIGWSSTKIPNPLTRPRLSRSNTCAKMSLDLVSDNSESGAAASNFLIFNWLKLHNWKLEQFKLQVWLSLRNRTLNNLHEKVVVEFM